jgi:tRNA(Arg) A34 adenosine deaminase TadA
MKNQDKKIMITAMEEASKSIMNMQHGCVIIDRKGDVLAKACNRYIGLRNFSIPYIPGKKMSCHAEENALSQVDPKKLHGARLYVTRISHTDGIITLKYSKPCVRCTAIIHKYMKNYGLQKVFYTSDDYELAY